MSEASEQKTGAKRLEVKKYPNRRYYDTTHSRHLTLEEIRDLVRDGHDVRVEDSRTGADITAQVLTQIILEFEAPKLESFPAQMLIQIIRANERAVGDFIERYFTQAFTAYLDYQKQMEERLRQFHASPGALNPFAAFAPGFFNPFGKSGPSAESASKGSSGDEMRALVTELQKQVAALQTELRTSRRKGGK